MKKIIASILLLTSVVYACHEYDDNALGPDSRIMVDIQSTGFESKDLNGNVRQAFLDFDSIYLKIESFTINVEDEPKVFNFSSDEGIIDLLSFVSRDTVLWEYSEIGEGVLSPIGVIKIDPTSGYIIDTDGEKYPIVIKHPSLNFQLISDDEIERGHSYGIKLDFMNSLQIVEGYEGEYFLQQGKQEDRNVGMMFLYPIQTN